MLNFLVHVLALCVIRSQQVSPAVRQVSPFQEKRNTMYEQPVQDVIILVLLIAPCWHLQVSKARLFISVNANLSYVTLLGAKHDEARLDIYFAEHCRKESKSSPRAKCQSWERSLLLIIQQNFSFLSCFSGGKSRSAPNKDSLTTFPNNALRCLREGEITRQFSVHTVSQLLISLHWLMNF